jgi:hypothetical protein
MQRAGDAPRASTLPEKGTCFLRDLIENSAPQNASGALRAENSAKTMEEAKAAGNCPGVRPSVRVGAKTSGSASVLFSSDK